MKLGKLITYRTNLADQAIQSTGCANLRQMTFRNSQSAAQFKKNQHKSGKCNDEEQRRNSDDSGTGQDERQAVPIMFVPQSLAKNYLSLEYVEDEEVIEDDGGFNPHARPDRDSSDSSRVSSNGRRLLAKRLLAAATTC